MNIAGYDVTVRQWTAEDRVPLLHMVQDCLDVNHQAGADMLPTYKNVDVLVKMGMLASDRGEPCLIADVAAIGPVGYTLWCELPNPLGLDFAARVLHGLGTYVLPPYRRVKVSEHLRNVAEAQAKRLGFEKIVGVAYHEAGAQSVLRRGFTVVGAHVEKRL